MSFDAFRSAIAGAKVYELAHQLDMTIPVSPNHPGYKMALQRRHGDNVRADGASASNEMIVIGGHTGTHIDALSHVSQDGKLHGGVDAFANQTGGKHKLKGMETVKPFFCRGILADVAGYKGADALDPATKITADDLKATFAKQGVAEPGKGDCVIVRSGWTKHWGDTHNYLGHESGVPGPDVSAAAYLAEKGIAVTGHDSMAYEWLAPGAGHSLLPVHRIFLVENGIHIIENLNMDELAAAKIYEFLFVCLPLPFVGATGSPVRPVAIVS